MDMSLKRYPCTRLHKYIQYHHKLINFHLPAKASNPNNCCLLVATELKGELREKERCLWYMKYVFPGWSPKLLTRNCGFPSGPKPVSFYRGSIDYIGAISKKQIPQLWVWSRITISVAFRRPRKWAQLHVKNHGLKEPHPASCGCLKVLLHSKFNI
jgi:hypothetical protein